MPNNSTPYGKVLFGWQIPEYEQHERGKWWYVIYSIIAIGCLVLSFATPNFAFDQPNFLFAVIIVLTTFVLYTRHFKEPEYIDFMITSEGIVIDNVLYDYDTIYNFSIIYKPNEDVKVLYISFKNRVRPRLNIPLLDEDPVKIREIFLRYIQEDLERVGESNTEFWGKYFKI